MKERNEETFDLEDEFLGGAAEQDGDLDWIVVPTELRKSSASRSASNRSG